MWFHVPAVQREGGEKVGERIGVGNYWILSQSRGKYLQGFLFHPLPLLPVRRTQANTHVKSLWMKGPGLGVQTSTRPRIGPKFLTAVPFRDGPALVHTGSAVGRAAVPSAPCQVKAPCNAFAAVTQVRPEYSQVGFDPRAGLLTQLHSPFLQLFPFPLSSLLTYLFLIFLL